MSCFQPRYSMAIMIYKSQTGRFDLTFSQIDHTNLVI